MENERVTIRLSPRDIHFMELFIKLGGYTSRSEVLRRAFHEFVNNHLSEVLKTAEELKQVQQIYQELQAVEPYMRK